MGEDFVATSFGGEPTNSMNNAYSSQYRRNGPENTYYGST